MSETCSYERLCLDRRAFLGGAAAFSVWSGLPAFARAGGRDPRLVTVVLRGGLDGLAAVAPVGDPDYARVRDGFELPADGPDARRPLDGFFALNSPLATLHDLYRAGEALVVHAAHTPYRERSHFDAQDVLENGTGAAGHDDDGWLGRLIAALPAEDRIAAGGGFAVAPAAPLILRGSPDVLTWMPPGLAPAPDDTRLRLLALYEHTDPALAEALESGLDLERVTGSERQMLAEARAAMGDDGARARVREVRLAAASAGRIMAADDGPRIGVLDMTGFDTHRQQRAVDGRLASQLALLDGCLATLKEGLGPAWRDTVVVFVTEFGRTVRLNGSRGTDHGAATVALLAGGAVAGGRVLADWPGLSDRALFEGRDLMPTTDLRAVLKGVLADHLGVPPRLLATRVFPGTLGLTPVEGLVRA